MATAAAPRPFATGDYWRRIFARNPDFCSWQCDKQKHVLEYVTARLDELPGAVRVLDFGVGNLGLYRAFDDALMRRLALTGTSESEQHRSDDPLLARYHVRILIGAGLAPLELVENGSQDVVLCTYVLDYLDAQMRADVLAAFARVLAPGGRLVLALHHPQGERQRKFQRAARFWPEAHALYDRLISGRYAEARELLQVLNALLRETFGADAAFARYLASYLKVATRFIEAFCSDTETRLPQSGIPRAALSDCGAMLNLIEREWSMTSESLQPIEDPGETLPLPAALRVADVAECSDPSCGSPLANVMTAVRSTLH